MTFDPSKYTFEGMLRDVQRQVTEVYRRPALNGVTAPYLTPDALPVPKAPLGLTVVENQPYRLADGTTFMARIVLDWNPVTQNVNNVPILVTEYEIWMERDGGPRTRVAATTDTSARVDFPSGSLVRLFVRAGVTRNIWSAFSSHVDVNTAIDLEPMDAPTAPIVTSKLGSVVVDWNGNLVTGAPPAKFRTVIAQIATSSTGPWQQAGPPFSSGGTVITGLTVGTTYWVRLIARDSLLIDSAPSATASVTVVGVGAGEIEVGAVTLPDLDAAIVDAITDAQADAAAALTAAAAAELAADGKSKVWRQTSAPAGTDHNIGDTWFDTDDDNRIYQWDGAAWVSTELGSNAIANAAITNAKIADATIQNAKIANLDAAKITTGTLSADRIAANSISTSKLLIASLDNILEDPGFELNNGVAWPDGTASVSKTTTTPRSGAYALRMVSTGSDYEATRHAAAIPVLPGQEYLYSAWVRMEGAGVGPEGGVELSMAYGATATTTSTTAFVNDSVPLGSTYTRVFGTWTVPAGVFFARPRIVVRDTVAGNVYLLDDISLIERSTGELIVDGSITATQLAADSVTATQLAAGSVSADSIQAGAITANAIAADAVTANAIASGAVTADSISAGEIEAYHLKAGVGAALDISSNTSINLLITELDSTNTAVQGVQGQVADITTYYRFGGDEALIGKDNGLYELALNPGGIEIRESGVAVSTWTSGQMIVPSAVVEQVVLGNHQIEKYGTGTVVRAL